MCENTSTKGWRSEGQQVRLDDDDHHAQRCVWECGSACGAWVVDSYRLRSTVRDGWYKMVENNAREKKRERGRKKKKESSKDR